ncbi:MAG: hypothetical protein IRZ16_09220 [Myxococcaceae bacterium]|nr:hypothetical protein [Myxococcaceae bacterium]
MIRSLLIVIAVLLPLAAAPARAQSVEHLTTLLRHMAGGVADASVGDWVTYRVSGGPDGRISFWRAAVVGHETDRFGREALWVEIEMGLHEKMVAPLFQTRILVATKAEEGRPAITRMYMAWGAEKVRELDDAAVAKMTSPSQLESPDDEPKGDPSYIRVGVGGEKRLMTLAGTVTAVPTEVRYGTTVVKRIWMSREIPLMHLAKLEVPPIDYAIEIRDYGRDAKPRMILPVDGVPKLSFEGGGPFQGTTLFPAQVNEAIRKERENLQRGEADAH